MVVIDKDNFVFPGEPSDCGTYMRHVKTGGLMNFIDGEFTLVSKCFHYDRRPDLYYISIHIAILLVVFLETYDCPDTCQCAVDAERHELRNKLVERTSFEIDLTHRRYDVAQRIEARRFLRPVWH